LRALLVADRPSFCARRGLGEAKFVQLQAVLEMARRHLSEGLRREGALTGPEDTRRLLALQLRDRPYEVFACLFLDTRHRVIAFEELFRGTIDGASVHPRELVRRALEHNAAAVILAHNHPSGVAEPSAADRQITMRLKDALALVDVRVLDHCVVGDEVVSFAERGLL
jgi:DNA repair protein RadC